MFRLAIRMADIYKRNVDGRKEHKCAMYSLPNQNAMAKKKNTERDRTTLVACEVVLAAKLSGISACKSSYHCFISSLASKQ